MPYKDPEVRKASKRAYDAARRAAQGEMLRIQQAAYRAAHREEAAAYRAAHRAEVSVYNAAYKRAHPEETRVYNAAYCVAHPEQNRAKVKAWRLANPGRSRVRRAAYYAANREEAIAKTAAWKKAHPDERRVNDESRRAHKAQAPVNDLSAPQWREIQEVQDHRCAHCQTRCKGRLTQDHILALSNGGSHTLHNVIGVCGSCNSKKGTKPSPLLVQPLLLTLAPAKKR